MAELIMTFGWDGTVKKETRGFVGTDCVEKTKFIEEALGDSGKRKFKAEYYDKPEQEREKLRG